MECPRCFSLGHACVSWCMREEKGWKVLVLEKVYRSLQNQGMPTRYGKDIS